MTGYTVNTGSTKQFAEGWDRVFSRAKKKGAKQPAATQKESARRGKRK